MKELSNGLFRIIDSNINRLGEGLRVLEEFARMTLNDTRLSQKLKDIRHHTVQVTESIRRQLLNSRDAVADVGKDMDVIGEGSDSDVSGIITANAKRAQESLRVLEEISKQAESGLDTDKYRKARFDLYAIEKELTARIIRKDKLVKLTGLYPIIDTEWLGDRDPADVASRVIWGGAGVIQLRCKDRPVKEFLAIARTLKEICAKRDVSFIVNDSLEVALAVKADGLHVGQEDMPVIELKKLIPVDMILGCSVKTVDEAIKAFNEGVDYLGIGAMFPTDTKKSSKVVGARRIKEIKKTVNLPVVAIGGINKENIAEVVKANADAIAVISAVMGAENIEKATRELVNIIEGIKVE